MIVIDREAIEAINAMAADVKRHRKQRFLKRGHGKVLIHEGRPTARHMKRRLMRFLRANRNHPRLRRLNTLKP